jgi:large subunit ribosomal protein L3
MLLKRAMSSWTPSTKRIGSLAVKVGMTALQDSTGVRVGCTVLQLENVQVVAHRTVPYTAMQVGCVDAKAKNVHAGLLGHFKKNAVQPKRKVTEFRVEEDGLVPVGELAIQLLLAIAQIAAGATLKAAHFVPGQYVDAQANS